MWLITYSQRPAVNMQPIVANTVLDSDCRPAIWLAGVRNKWPEADTKLLFAIGIEDEEGAYLREAL